MKFRITRASGDTDEKGSPYDGPYYGAVQGEYIYTERHPYVSVRSIEDAKRNTATSGWLEDGDNHREVELEGKYYLVRDVMLTEWFIELPSIADLYSFMEEVEHSVVIDRDKFNPGYLKLIIYDDYMD